MRAERTIDIARNVRLESSTQEAPPRWRRWEDWMRITASKLRENVYRILDEVLATGVPVEIERKGRLLRVVAAEPTSRLSRLERRNFVLGAPETLLDLDWSAEWRP